MMLAIGATRTPIFARTVAWCEAHTHVTIRLRSLRSLSQSMLGLVGQSKDLGAFVFFNGTARLFVLTRR